MGVMSGKISLISLSIGSARTLPVAPTVVSTVGTPRTLAVRARAATLLISRAWSMEGGEHHDGWLMSMKNKSRIFRGSARLGLPVMWTSDYSPLNVQQPIYACFLLLKPCGSGIRVRVAKLRFRRNRERATFLSPHPRPAAFQSRNHSAIIPTRRYWEWLQHGPFEAHAVSCLLLRAVTDCRLR
jgi:hypothetical protein